MNTKRISGILVILLLAVFSLTACAQEAPKIKTGLDEPAESESRAVVTYIANEGVLISGGGRSVMIDGLHRFYRVAYAYPPDDLREKLESALEPYRKIDLLLVSHIHGDHFHPESAGLRLQNDPASVLASSPQIISAVRKDFNGSDNLGDRLKEVAHEWKKETSISLDGIKVRFLGLRHGSERFAWVENLGHVVELNGLKFLHIGDADMTEENFASFKLADAGIDVAFIPFWFLLSSEGRELVDKQFAPKHIVAVHVSPSDADEVTEELKRHYGKITVFTRILEQRRF